MVSDFSTDDAEKPRKIAWHTGPNPCMAAYYPVIFHHDGHVSELLVTTLHINFFLKNWEVNSRTLMGRTNPPPHTHTHLPHDGRSTHPIGDLLGSVASYLSHCMLNLRAFR